MRRRNWDGKSIFGTTILCLGMDHMWLNCQPKESIAGSPVGLMVWNRNKGSYGLDHCCSSLELI